MFLKYFLVHVYLVVFVTNYISAPLPWCRTDPYPPLSSTRASRHLSTSSSIPRLTHTVTPDLEIYHHITPQYNNTAPDTHYKIVRALNFNLFGELFHWYVVEGLCELLSIVSVTLSNSINTDCTKIFSFLLSSRLFYIGKHICNNSLRSQFTIRRGTNIYVTNIYVIILWFVYIWRGTDRAVLSNERILMPETWKHGTI